MFWFQSVTTSARAVPATARRMIAAAIAGVRCFRKSDMVVSFRRNRRARERAGFNITGSYLRKDGPRGRISDAGRGYGNTSLNSVYNPSPYKLLTTPEKEGVT